jgi:hypothetical protein
VLTRREITRLMVLALPGAAKSTYTYRIFPVWFMARHPHLSVTLVSHTSELSEVNSVHVQTHRARERENRGHSLPGCHTASGMVSAS